VTSSGKRSKVALD